MRTCSPDRWQAQLPLATLMQIAVFAADTVTMRRLHNRWLQGAQNTHVQALRQKAEQEGRQVVIVSAQVWDPVFAAAIDGCVSCETSLECCTSADVHCLHPCCRAAPSASCDHLQVESELKDLEPEDAAEYLESLGATEGGLNRWEFAGCILQSSVRTYLSKRQTAPSQYLARQRCRSS